MSKERLVILASLFALAFKMVCSAQDDCIYRVTASECQQEPKERILTGFMVQGTRGIYTALHGVVDSNKIGAVSKAAHQAFSSLAISKVDVEHDVAILDSSELDDKGLPGLVHTDYSESVGYGTLSVVGYPLGINLMWTRNLLLRERNLVELRTLLQDDAIAPVKERGSPFYKAKMISIQGKFLPGHSGAPVLDSQNRVVAMANGGLLGGLADISWAVPLSDLELDPKSEQEQLLNKLRNLKPDSVFFIEAAPKIWQAETPTASPTARPETQLSAMSYVLTTTTDPVQPGKMAQFTITVTNLTDSRVYSELAFHVPQFTAYGRFPEGTAYSLAPGWVDAGASISANLDLKVLGGNQSPPNGTIITLVLTDLRRAASFSHSVTVNDAPVAILDLSTPQGTVAPGETFDYFLAYHNASGDTLPGAQLSMTVPVGASLVSMDGNGVLGPDQAVRWPLGALAAGVTGQVHLNLKALTAKGEHPALLVQAALHDSGNHLLTKASDFKAVYAAPTFSYMLTTTTDTVQPGKMAQFTIKVTNLTDSRAYSELAFHVPRFTSYGRFPEGTAYSLAPGWVDAGASISANLDLKVLGGNHSPPDGTIITLMLTDLSRGASFSHSVGVNQKIAVLPRTSSLMAIHSDHSAMSTASGSFLLGHGRQ